MRVSHSDLIIASSFDATTKHGDTIVHRIYVASFAEQVVDHCKRNPHLGLLIEVKPIEMVNVIKGAI